MTQVTIVNVLQKFATLFTKPALNLTILPENAKKLQMKRLIAVKNVARATLRHRRQKNVTKKSAMWSLMSAIEFIQQIRLSVKKELM